MNLHQAYLALQDDKISEHDALQWLVSLLTETEGELEAIRNSIAMIVAQHPDQVVDYPDLPKMVITKPSSKPSISYRSETVDQVRLELIRRNISDLFDMLEGARKVNQPRSGGLRISKR